MRVGKSAIPYLVGSFLLPRLLIIDRQTAKLMERESFEASQNGLIQQLTAR
jgi:hypothetical protein